MYLTGLALTKCFDLLAFIHLWASDALKLLCRMMPTNLGVLLLAHIFSRSISAKRQISSTTGSALSRGLQHTGSAQLRQYRWAITKASFNHHLKSSGTWGREFVRQLLFAMSLPWLLNLTFYCWLQRVLKIICIPCESPRKMHSCLKTVVKMYKLLYIEALTYIHSESQVWLGTGAYREEMPLAGQSLYIV